MQRYPPHWYVVNLSTELLYYYYLCMSGSRARSSQCAAVLHLMRGHVRCIVTSHDSGTLVALIESALSRPPNLLCALNLPGFGEHVAQNTHKHKMHCRAQAFKSLGARISARCASTPAPRPSAPALHDLGDLCKLHRLPATPLHVRPRSRPRGIVMAETVEHAVGAFMPESTSALTWTPSLTGIGGRFRYSNSSHPYFQHHDRP